MIIIIVFFIYLATTNIHCQSESAFCFVYDQPFLEETPYILNALSQLLCVDANSSQSSNFMSSMLNTVTDKQAYVSQLARSSMPSLDYVPISADLTSLTLNANATSFTARDFVWTLLASNRLGYLSLPQQVGDTCELAAPTTFLRDKKTACVVPYASIVSQCLTPSATSSLSLQYFVDKFKIVRTPNSLSACQAQNAGISFTFFNNCSESYALSVPLRRCTLANGTLIADCQAQMASSLSATPLMDSTGTVCNFVVSSVTYLLAYNDASGVTQAAIDVTFAQHSIADTLGYLSQQFEVVFVPDSLGPLSQFDGFTALSGNPGYLNAKPLVVMYNTSNHTTQSRLTYFRPDNNGLCPVDNTFREAARFDVNAAAECLLSLSLPAPLSCNDLQAQVDSVIYGFVKAKQPLYFSPFGVANETLWKAIDNTKPTTLPTQTSTSCNSVRTGAIIQVAYAQVGNNDQPQMKIVSIAYYWNRLTDIQIKCNTNTCTNTNSVRLKTSVTFVNVSQQPAYSQSILVYSSYYLPSDFFYPFSGAQTTLGQQPFLFVAAFFACFFSTIYLN